MPASKDPRTAWSPDGQQIVFASARPNDALFVINADGTGEAPLLDQDGNAIPGTAPEEALAVPGIFVP